MSVHVAPGLHDINGASQVRGLIVAWSVCEASRGIVTRRDHTLLWKKLQLLGTGLR